MRPLYEINQDIERCIAAGTDFETGEFLGWEELSQLEMERDTKFENVALFVKDTRAEADAIKAEIERLEKRMKKLYRNADGAEYWLAENLKGEKFNTPKVECSFHKSVSVECDEEFTEWAMGTGLFSFLTHHESDSPNKTRIKEFLKKGGSLEHCKLVEKNNLTVK